MQADDGVAGGLTDEGAASFDELFTKRGKGADAGAHDLHGDHMAHIDGDSFSAQDADAWNER